MKFETIDVGLDAIEEQIVESRVVQNDTDFTCYFVADTEKPAIDNFKNLLKKLEVRRRELHAGHLNAHITIGSKGGRPEMATVKAYQEKRVTGTEVKERVREIRTLLANWAGTDRITVIAHNIVEADDGIVTYHHAAMKAGLQSIIDSGDKDMNAAKGIHRDSYTGRLVNVKGFGKTAYKDVGNAELKLTGFGTSFFWHQMLMGDTADNIPGLEKVPVDVLNRIKPLKKHNPKRKPALCGEKTAWRILDGVTNDLDAFNAVWGCYKGYYGSDAAERFVEQMFLLWIRRTNDPWDCLVFLDEVTDGKGLQIRPTKRQREVVEEWMQLMSALYSNSFFEGI